MPHQFGLVLRAPLLLVARLHEDGHQPLRLEYLVQKKSLLPVRQLIQVANDGESLGVPEWHGRSVSVGPDLVVLLPG